MGTAEARRLLIRSALGILLTVGSGSRHQPGGRRLPAGALPASRAVNFQSLSEHRAISEVALVFFTSRGPQTRPQFGVLNQHLESFAQVFGVVVWNQETGSAVIDGLADAA